jgi:glycosyltransferase involved in cell wall biosynthesis
MLKQPRVSFGIIVLNGEPFVRYCLRALYPYAHEIIVVEGGHEDARAVMTADGHSIDGTLEALAEFQEGEDPEGKVTIVTRDGPWPKLDELGRCRTAQSRAYAERATGDYLWQVDIDEFYQPEAMSRVLDLLQKRPEVTAVSFQQRTFWGSTEYWADSWALRRGAGEYHRLFKWGPGFKYLTHEPPTVLDAAGTDSREVVWVRGDEMLKIGVELYHYSLLLPSQVQQKCRVYAEEKPEACSRILEWADASYTRLERPYRVHNLYEFPSWLRRYRGTHPPQIVQMMRDIETGAIAECLRDMSDADQLVHSLRYGIGWRCRRAGDYPDRVVKSCRMWLRRAKRAVVGILSRLMSNTIRVE